MKKEGYVEKCGAAPADEMELINRYTRREYKEDEVYTFSLVLCDNEIDRDFERFSVSALDELKTLFLGKTCILDHERKSVNQTARIYATETETVPGRVTKSGEPYTRLTARAYLPRTAKTVETIELIDSGILKEVSISCAVKTVTCSVCGKESCGHQSGKVYGGVLCCRVLSNATDAYECSFVAVPAQREAGVRKGYSQAEPTPNEDELAALREQAQWGEQYRRSLVSSVLKSCAIAQPELPAAIVKSAVSALSMSELTELSTVYEKLAQKRLPITPQLAPREREKEKVENLEFKI